MKPRYPGAGSSLAPTRLVHNIFDRTFHEPFGIELRAEMLKSSRPGRFGAGNGPASQFPLPLGQGNLSLLRVALLSVKNRCVTDDTHNLRAGLLFKKLGQLRLLFLFLEIVKLHLDEFMPFKGLFCRPQDFGRKALLTDQDNRLQAVGETPQVFSLKTFKFFHPESILVPYFARFFSCFACFFSWSVLVAFFLLSYLVSLDFPMCIFVHESELR